SPLTLDLIRSDQAQTLHGLFLRRCERTPEREAYRQYESATAQWRSYTWRDMRALVARWQTALAREGLAPGERVAVLLKNSVEWVCLDQAAQALGLVVVPLYATDSPENIAYILGDSGTSLLLLDGIGQWQALAPLRAQFPQLARTLCVSASAHAPAAAGVLLSFIADWLPDTDEAPSVHAADPGAVATIVYTSGTTGRPKGVMLSHRNILWDVEAVLQLIPGYAEDLYLSFLPLSHSFERTVGYYLPMTTGSTVVYARSVQELAKDLLTIRPSMLVSVPRIYERVYAKLQQGLEQKGAPARALFRWAEEIGWHRFEAAQHRGAAPGPIAQILWPLLRHLVADKILSRLGGRLRIAMSGGAPISPKLSRCFIGLGLPLLQGYGLTEASPIVTANSLDNNLPESVGVALPGMALKLGDKNELLVKGPNVMLGYWNDPQKTREAVDEAGWLHTGDVARIDDDGHVYIVGRLKEILVMSTGEKVAPNDLELAIAEDPLFDQAMVVGEGKPHLAALIVLNAEAWREFARSLALDSADPKSLAAPAALQSVRDRVGEALHSFPACARVREVWLTLEPWTIENGLITPTMKLKRMEIARRFAGEIRRLYSGHDLPAVFCYEES
ncbi:MAG TPA: long-chain fatty acid--CoA ligase, partial [Rhodocyclaceae bacterium]|nr:long-chain fatty acid--CoA ligase [Rhodocyclaceae bacterium]